jgi:hypothetical protein
MIKSVMWFNNFTWIIKYGSLFSRCRSTWIRTDGYKDCESFARVVSHAGISSRLGVPDVPKGMGISPLSRCDKMTDLASRTPNNTSRGF